MQIKHENTTSAATYAQFSFKFIQLLTDPGYRLSFALIVLVSLALFYQTFSFGFIWDDLTIALTKNERLIHPSFSNILYFWLHPENGMYIPVTYTVWSIIELFNHTILETAFYPGTYHVINFLVHTFNGLLVLTIVHRFVKSSVAATAGAILFLIHPLQIEVVAWAFELRMLLATCFGFYALYLYLIFLDKYAGVLESKIVPFPWGSLVFFALALLSKPVAVVIPVFFIAVSSLLYGQTIVLAIRRVWPWLLLAITIAVITLIEQPQEQLTFQFDYPLWSSPLVWMDNINFYMTKILFPISLSSSFAS